MKLDGMGLFVKDMATMIQFYRDVLGLEIKETEEGKTIKFEIKVAESDMGKVIGKQGRIAKSIRTVMKSVSAKEGKKVAVEFLDN